MHFLVHSKYRLNQKMYFFIKIKLKRMKDEHLRMFFKHCSVSLKHYRV